MMPSTIPPVAIPRPPWPGLRLIWESAITPSRMLTGERMSEPQQASDAMPVPKDHPASGLLDGTAAGEGGRGGLGAARGGVGVRTGENSGMSRNCFQMPEPSAWILLWLLSLPSDNHWRTCSAVTGPYSTPSAPMILYITAGDPKQRGSSSLFPVA